jgi:hypothetical protein
MLIGGIVHRDNQVLLLPRYPLVATAILMDHQPRPGRTIPALAMDAPRLGLGQKFSLLQPALHPSVAAPAAILAVPSVKMLRPSPHVPLPILSGHPQYFIHGRFLV